MKKQPEYNKQNQSKCTTRQMLKHNTHTCVSSALSHFDRPILALSALALVAPALAPSLLSWDVCRTAFSAENTPVLVLPGRFNFSERYSGVGSKENKVLAIFSDMPVMMSRKMAECNKARENGKYAKKHNAVCMQLQKREWPHRIRRLVLHSTPSKICLLSSRMSPAIR